MSWKLKKTVALVGMMGAGKTAVGKALAARLNVPFLDSDAEIEAAANMTVAEIFARDGEPFFRAKESQVIQRLLETECCILSTGGGAFMSDQNQQMISEKGVAVWLNAGLDLLWQRVRHKDTRPLLRASDPLAVLTGLYERRTPIYARADLHVDVQPGFSIEETTSIVVNKLLTRPDVLEKVE